MNQPEWKRNLVKGYQQFRAEPYKTQKSLYEETGKYGQNPDVMVIACSDSRVNPSTIFNAFPGEMFILRNVANIVPPFDETAGYHGTSAAIEFAVNVLKVKAIIVMGHENCGGISAFIASLDVKDTAHSDEFSFLDSWIQILDKAHERLASTDADNARDQLQMEYASIRQSLVNLMRFPFVEKAVKSGELSLLGAFFSVIQGKLMFANQDGIFEEVHTKKN